MYAAARMRRDRASGCLLVLTGIWIGGSAQGCALLDAAGGGVPGDTCPDAGECGEMGPFSPIAHAGSDQVVPRGSLVTLDGLESRTSGSTTYSWTLTRPAGSSATLTNAQSAQPTFVADLEGEYVATLVVADREKTGEPDSATITAENRRPIGDAGRDRLAPVRAAVVLEGGATDPNDDPVAYRWTFVSSPPGSAAVLDDPTIATPAFVPDIEGDYRLELVVSDGRLAGEPAVVTVTGYRPLALLDHRVTDAEYSDSLARIVMISESPDRLYIHDPTGGTEAVVDLPTRPTAVSVSPDGTHAAVGHNGWVSHVRLTDAALLETHPVSAIVGDVVLTGNGFAYAGPRGGDVRCLELSTGRETLHTGHPGDAGSRMKAHPSGMFLYTVDDDIAKFDISGGTATYLYSTPYTSDYRICDDLWMSEDGLRIFTRCGNVFRASPNPERDLTYNGSFADVDYIRHLDHHAVGEVSKIALIPDVSEFFPPKEIYANIRVYDYQFLEFERSVPIPKFGASEALHAVHGRFVFISADGKKLFVIAQVDKTAGLVDDFGVLIYGL